MGNLTELSDVSYQVCTSSSSSSTSKFLNKDVSLKFWTTSSKHTSMYYGTFQAPPEPEAEAPSRVNRLFGAAKEKCKGVGARIRIRRGKEEEIPSPEESQDAASAMEVQVETSPAPSSAPSPKPVKLKERTSLKSMIY